MRTKHNALIGLVIVTAASGALAAQRPAAAAAAADTSNEWNWRGRVAAGKDVVVRGLTGDIRATAGRGPEVVVHATKKAGYDEDRRGRRRGRRGDPADVRIVVEQSADGVTICAVYPSQDAGPNECPSESRRRHHNSEDDETNNVSVEFTVEVPAGVNFIGETVNGDVDADSMPANAEAHSVNGSVSLSARGHGSASSVNGSVRATLGRADWTREAEFSSVNGEVVVVLPGDVNANITASTVIGDITTDFPLMVQGRVGRGQLRGKIGTGGVELTLSSVNGSIRLRKR
jgi:hypothetical protein